MTEQSSDGSLELELHMLRNRAAAAEEEVGRLNGRIRSAVAQLDEILGGTSPQPAPVWKKVREARMILADGMARTVEDRTVEAVRNWLTRPLRGPYALMEELAEIVRRP